MGVEEPNKELIDEDSSGARECNINLERRMMLESEMHIMESSSAASELSALALNNSHENQRTRKTWKQRKTEQASDWENSKEEFYNAFISSQAFVKKNVQ